MIADVRRHDQLSWIGGTYPLLYHTCYPRTLCFPNFLPGHAAACRETRDSTQLPKALYSVETAKEFRVHTQQHHMGSPFLIGRLHEPHSIKSTPKNRKPVKPPWYNHLPQLILTYLLVDTPTASRTTFYLSAPWDHRQQCKIIMTSTGSNSQLS